MSKVPTVIDKLKIIVALRKESAKALRGKVARLLLVRLTTLKLMRSLNMLGANSEIRL